MKNKEWEERAKIGFRRRNIFKKRKCTVDTKFGDRRIASFLQSHTIIEPSELAVSAL